MSAKKSRPLCLNLSLIFILIGAIPIIYSMIVFPSPPDIRDWNYIQTAELSSRPGSQNKQGNFSFAVYGDNKNSITVFNEIIDKINQDDVDFSIETGDLIDNMIDGESEYKTYVQQIKRSTKPLMVIPGNHETAGSSSAYGRLFGDLYYSFAYKNAYFIALNGSHEDGPGPQQFDWLKDQLEKSQSYAYRFVFMHIPLYDPEAGEYQLGHSLRDKSVSEKLNKLFDDKQVTMVFTAHVHGYYTGKWKNTPFTITGGAGAELGGTDPDHYFYHYIKVGVSENGVSYDVVKTHKPFSNIFSLFAHNATEFMHSYIIAHWDYLLLLIGLICFGLHCCFLCRKRNS